MGRKINYVLTISVLLGLVLGAFQNCSNSKLRFLNQSSNNKQMTGASGHGSGYDGKLNPGRFLRQENGHNCQLTDGTNTNVRSMIRVYEDGNINYFDSCREENPQPVEESSLTFLYESVVVFNGEAFQQEEGALGSVPDVDEFILLGTCFFENIEEPNFDGALLSAQVSYYESVQNNNIVVDTVFTEMEGDVPQTVAYPLAEAMDYINGNSTFYLNVINPYSLEMGIDDRPSGITDLSLHIEGRGLVRTSALDVCTFNQ